MVRLELKSGNELWVRPSQVSHLMHGYIQGWTGLHVGGQRFEVRGELGDIVALLGGE